MDNEPSNDRLSNGIELPLSLPVGGSWNATDQHPPMVIVYDALQACPYLDRRVARMPLEYPKRRLTATDVDHLLAAGYRRSGAMFYRTQCPQCQACIPTRLQIDQFEPTKSFKRIFNRGRRELEISWGRPAVDADRLRIFNRHRSQRGLSHNRTATLGDYHEFLVASCVHTSEIAFRKNGELIGIAIVDLGDNSLNAVYTHFDPDHGRYSIGTLAVLHQVELARQTGRRHVYLGLYVEQNPHLNYKGRFRPQQRLIGDQWRNVDSLE